MHDSKKKETHNELWWFEHLGNKNFLKLSVVFPFWSDSLLPRNTVNTHRSVAAFSKRRGNGPSTRCAFTSGCAGTGRANINQWSQEWNQGGRVVPHNAASGEVRERCTPCLVSVPHASLPTHTHAILFIHTWKYIVNATASPSHDHLGNE